MSISIQTAVKVENCVGEGAIWSVAQQALLWCDIMGPANDGHGELHRFDPATAAHQYWSFEQPLGCFAEAKDGSFVLAMSAGFHRFEPATGALQRLCGPDVRDAGQRFNDGSVDPAGRFYAGTMELGLSPDRSDSGVLYRYHWGAQERVEGGYYIINGMAFSPDGKTAYRSDSFAPIRTIFAYDYDVTDGVFTNKRVFFDTNAVRGRPDGATIDSDGCYWMAGVSGAELVRITPAGKIDMRIDMPVEKPSRPAFGGSDLKTLYVTSLREGISDPESQPDAGAVFALEVPGVQGVPFPTVPS